MKRFFGICGDSEYYADIFRQSDIELLATNEADPAGWIANEINTKGLTDLGVLILNQDLPVYPEQGNIQDAVLGLRKAQPKIKIYIIISHKNNPKEAVQWVNRLDRSITQVMLEENLEDGAFDIETIARFLSPTKKDPATPESEPESLQEHDDEAYEQIDEILPEIEEPFESPFPSTPARVYEEEKLVEERPISVPISVHKEEPIQSQAQELSPYQPPVIYPDPLQTSPAQPQGYYYEPQRQEPPRVIGCYSIAIMGTTLGVGVTHTTMMLADYFSDRNLRVSIVSMSPNEYTSVAEEDEKGHAQYQQIRIFRTASNTPYTQAHAVSDVVIYDCGHLSQPGGSSDRNREEALSEFQRANVRILVTGLKPWQQIGHQTATRMSDRLGKYTLAVPMASSEELRDANKKLGKCLAIPFLYDPAESVNIRSEICEFLYGVGVPSSICGETSYRPSNSAPIATWSNVRMQPQQTQANVPYVPETTYHSSPVNTDTPQDKPSFWQSGNKFVMIAVGILAFLVIIVIILAAIKALS